MTNEGGYSAMPTVSDEAAGPSDMAHLADALDAYNGAILPTPCFLTLTHVMNYELFPARFPSTTHPPEPKTPTKLVRAKRLLEIPKPTTFAARRTTQPERVSEHQLNITRTAGSSYLHEKDNRQHLLLILRVCFYQEPSCWPVLLNPKPSCFGIKTR